METTGPHTRRTFLRTTTGACALAALWGVGGGRARAAAGRPNILLVLADDMGYSDAGCYGGEIRTPTLDTLAAGGPRLTQFYSTGRCWPSRACILTGYYAQHIRRDRADGIALGERPAWAPLLPRRLAPLGYHSYQSGKWHIDGDPKENGFERSWGRERHGCDWDRYFASETWTEDGTRAPGARTNEGYYSTVAIADHALVCGVGATKPQRCELDPELFGRAAGIITDSLAGAPDECGDLIHAVDAGIVAWADVLDLADVLAGRVHVGRAGPDGPVVFETQGVAIQDVVAAALVWRAGVASPAHDVATAARRRPVRT